MLSVLIPIYHSDIRELVSALHQQALQQATSIEIICIDDHSGDPYHSLNARVGSLSGVSYEQLPENIGRSRIRNLLASRASQPYLLFIDGDSKIPDLQFLPTYLAKAGPQKVVCGGTLYPSTPPEDPQLFLHWHYGRSREALPLSQRLLKPYIAFKTNNFLIDKATFDKIGFDGSIRRYGHEDTLFAQELRERSITVEHIDNPVTHAGLEPAKTYLEKTETALETLSVLLLKPDYRSRLRDDFRLLQVHQRLSKFGLDSLLAFGFKLFKSSIRRQLLSRKPGLFWLDCYKLGYFCALEASQAVKANAKTGYR